mmetsp:Transcript_86501/g.279134  ORF Transcript_86501/g.279134 Transcript_86501/m.279134 type:complete len:261 (+) Transcript_86501:116-898(+)
MPTIATLPIHSAGSPLFGPKAYGTLDAEARMIDPPGPSRIRASIFLPRRQAGAAGQQRGAQGRELVVGAALEEEVREPDGSCSLHQHQSNHHHRVAQIRREHLGDHEDRRVREEVDRAREVEAVQERLQPEASAPLLRAHAHGEPQVEHDAHEQDGPTDDALVLVVFLGMVALHLAMAHEHDVEQGDDSREGLYRLPLGVLCLVQGVALRDEQEEGASHDLAKHEEDVRGGIDARLSDAVSLVREQVEQVQNLSSPLKQH